ncbi:MULTISPECIES: hypothetical protein [Dyadobacter]|nr:MULTISPECIES: hypothetical protein [Dyadobacter]SKC20109.1 hypothetical protein SAMN05660293_05594 [Dyadobacter psychrophilus]
METSISISRISFGTGCRLFIESKSTGLSLMVGFIIILFASAFIIGCNGSNTNNSLKTDSTAQSNVQRNGDVTEEIHKGMEMIKSGNELVNKGEKANDKSMIDNGMAEMDKGMQMVKAGQSTMNRPEHENEDMDDKMAMGDSIKKTAGKDMDMSDNGMNMIHQGLDVAKSGKMITQHALKNKDKPMMQTGMSMMDKGMAMITMGKEMMGKDSNVMADKPMSDDMDMMDKGMDMMDMGKGMTSKAMGPADKPMMDDDMDKGMDMMDKGMDMMGMGADKMKKDKKPMPMKDDDM